MRIVLNAANPHGYSRYGFAWQQLPCDTQAHLDFGCFDGKFLASLEGKNIRRLIGLDPSTDAIAAGRLKYPSLELAIITPGELIPFAEATFDSISLLDVLEHVADQPALLADLYRVLKPGGRLIVTVPRKHIFSFMDIGNLKFRFPRLHRWAYLHIQKHSLEEYNRRYVQNTDGLVGDISSDKRWHEHFSPSDLEKLLNHAGFIAEKFDGSGLFRRLVLPAGLILGRIAIFRRAFERFYRWDARHFESMNLFCMAVKHDKMA